MSRKPVTKERIEYVMSTPYDKLGRADKRLQSIIKKHGSYEASLEARMPDLVLGGINGGRHRGEKGFATWEKDEHKDFVARRERDSRGRFVADSTKEADTSTSQARD